jgi:nicotinamide riboside transporter PnuC
LLESFTHALLAVPAWNWTLQAIGVVFAYLGAEFNARLRIEGFFLWLASNVALAVLHALTGLWLLLVLDVLFFRVNLIGIRRWSRTHPDSLPPWLRAALRPGR